MPPILASNETEKMPRSWFDYGPGQLDRLASDEQRAWLHGTSQMGPPSRQTSLEGLGGLGGLGLGLGQNNHNNHNNHNHNNHNPGHGQSQGQTHGLNHNNNHHNGGNHNVNQFHRNTSLDNAVEDLLNNHLLSRAQRSESLASSHATTNRTGPGGRNQPAEFCPISGRLASNNDRTVLNNNGGGGRQHASNTMAGRLSSMSSMDLNPIGDRMSSIGSLGDVSELLNSANAGRTSAPRSGGVRRGSMNPSSESAVLYMEMLKNGYGPLFRHQSVPSPSSDPSQPQQQQSQSQQQQQSQSQQQQQQQQQQQPQQQQQQQPQGRPSAAELLMQHRLISLEPASADDLGRVPANLENLTNRLLENEKENSLIASTMASMIENNSKSSKDAKSVVSRIADRLHLGRGERIGGGYGYDDTTITNAAAGANADGSYPDPAKPQPRNSRPSPRRQVPPRRFLNLDPPPDTHRLPSLHPKDATRRHSGERPPPPPDVLRPSPTVPYRKDAPLPLPYRLPNPEETGGSPERAARSTAEASRSTAELLIQLNQGKLSSRVPSVESANGGWVGEQHGVYRRDGARFFGGEPDGAGMDNPAGGRRPVPPRSFLPSSSSSSGYPQGMPGMPGSVASGSRPILPQQPQQSQRQTHGYGADPQAGEKRGASDMVVKKEPETDDTTNEDGAPKSSADNAAAPNPQGLKRFKPYHEDKWMENFQQLLKFKEENGNCLVPHTYLPNPLLARWVKRQRRQYKLCLERCPQSTMTPERIDILNKEGFVWDSHEITWMRKFYDLIDYRKIHGHCRVPSCSKDHPQLATWVKCQRRQYRLKREGKSSAMTTQRIKLLDDVGFSWEVRFAAPVNNTTT